MFHINTGVPQLEPLPFSTYGEVAKPMDFFQAQQFLPPHWGGPPVGSAVSVGLFAGPTDITPGEYVVHIDYAAVRLYFTGGVSPPLRIHPRNDGLTGGARRVFPPAKSVQQSSRRGPGSYL
jgi:hypothetical protein